MLQVCLLLTLHVFKDKLEVKDLSTHSSFPGDTTVVTYSYDSLRRRVQRVYQDKGRSFTNYEYDSLGHVVRETKLDSIGEIQVVKLFKYNSLGKEVETISKGKGPNDKRPSYFSKNSVSRTSYDSLGREIKVTVYDHDELTFERTYSYDRKNRVIDEFDTKESRGTGFIYNKKGQITARYHYKNAFDKKNIIGIEILKYFKNGLIKTFTENIFNGRSEMRTLGYKYG